MIGWQKKLKKKQIIIYIFKLTFYPFRLNDRMMIISLTCRVSKMHIWIISRFKNTTFRLNRSKKEKDETVLCPVTAIKSFVQVNMTKYIFNGSHMLHKVQEENLKMHKTTTHSMCQMSTIKHIFAICFGWMIGRGVYNIHYLVFTQFHFIKGGCCIHERLSTHTQFSKCLSETPTYTYLPIREFEKTTLQFSGFGILGFGSSFPVN